MSLLTTLYSIVWPVGKVIPHSHSWRRLTSKDDYGNILSRHWGNYGGCDQEECRGCGLVREMDRELAKRQDAEEADQAAKFNLSDEGLSHWQRRSLKGDGKIMVYDGGTVCRLESGDPYNGESEVLSKGHDGKWFGPEMIFERGNLIFKRKAAA